MRFYTTGAVAAITSCRRTWSGTVILCLTRLHPRLFDGDTAHFSVTGLRGPDSLAKNRGMSPRVQGFNSSSTLINGAAAGNSFVVVRSIGNDTGWRVTSSHPRWGQSTFFGVVCAVVEGVDVGKSFAGCARQGRRAEAYRDVLAAVLQKNSRRPRRRRQQLLFWNSCLRGKGGETPCSTTLSPAYNRQRLLVEIVLA